MTTVPYLVIILLILGLIQLVRTGFDWGSNIEALADNKAAINDTQTQLHAPLDFEQACHSGECCGFNHSFFYLPNARNNSREEFHPQYLARGTAALGNTLTHYYNQRAIALLKNQVFRVNDEDQTLPKGIMSCYPMETEPNNYVEKDVFGNVSQALMEAEIPLDALLESHLYPHAVSIAAYHLIPQTIAQESQFIASKWAALPSYANNGPDNDTVVIHTRCDSYILQWHSDYGILPHRFVLDHLHLSSNATKVVMVHEPEAQENACTWSLQDLAHQLKAKGLQVSVRSSPDMMADWLFLAQAKTLFCAPSTFCLTAAWANPNTVVLGTNPHAAIVPVDPRLEQISAESTRLHMVPIDFLPGQVAANCSKQEVLNYARSTSCDPSHHGCLSAVPSPTPTA